MRRIAFIALALCAATVVFAQKDTTITRTTKAPGATTASDHFMLQLGYTTWQGKPDSIHTTGFPRTFNMYLMLAFPFKTNPQWSAAIGPGISSENIYFDKTYVGIKDPTTTLSFRNLKDTTHFKKYKLNTTYLEAPVELRFSSRPNDAKHSVKVALGAKVGTLLGATVKGKNLVDRNGNAVLTYTSKEKNKRFFNTTRLSVAGRIGYGNLSVFASYAITPVFKEGVGPQVRPLTIGLTLSGL